MFSREFSYGVFDHSSYVGLEKSKSLVVILFCKNIAGHIAYAVKLMSML